MFVVDSPIDLYALYESSVVDTKNEFLSKHRLAEPTGIIELLKKEFGQEEGELLANIEKVSPFTLKNKNSNITSLSEHKIRFYTEPDEKWYREYRQTEFENTNAFAIQQAGEQLKEMNFQNFELIETTNKGYNTNGSRNPHSWSIVDVDVLIITWIEK